MEVGMRSSEETGMAHQNFIDLEKKQTGKDVPAATLSVVIIDSDEEDDRDQKDDGDQKPFLPFQEVMLPKPVGQFPMKDIVAYHAPIAYHAESKGLRNVTSMGGRYSTSRDKGIYVGGLEEEDRQVAKDDNGLEDIWREM